MAAAAIDELPGFRRRFIIEPSGDQVRIAVEDDYHCMGVTLHFEGEIVTAVEPEMDRAPWTTCPGAIARLRETFTGVPLAAFAVRGEKATNCTHLHDLATLGAVHAHDARPTVIDILVSDPDGEGRSTAQLRRDGETALAWVTQGWQFVAPAALAGITIDKMRPWIDSLDPRAQEAARLLRWGTMLAHGRSIPMEQQSDAGKIAGSCYTFQPGVKEHARRVGVIRDFSVGAAEPLGNRRGDIDGR